MNRYFVAISLLLFMFTQVGCGSSTFEKRTPGWKSIELRDGLQGDYSEAWQITVDSLARSYDLEIIDKDSGYLRTSWKYGILGQDADTLAGRITVKFPDVSSPSKVDVKTDAQQYDIWTEKWVEGFDSAFERDIVSELSGRLGRVAQ